MSKSSKNRLARTRYWIKKYGRLFRTASSAWLYYMLNVKEPYGYATFVNIWFEKKRSKV